MALDGLVVHAIVHELQACAGGRINKIYQPAASDIVIQLRNQGSNFRLLLSANPTYPRVHLTEGQFINPPEAPMFCMLLRKHCEGAILESIEQVGLERMILFRVRQRDELGDISVKEIVVEIMGRHSNIILKDPESGIIHDGIHHVTPAISSYRVVMPGSKYVAPPDQDKADPFSATKDEFNQLLFGDAYPGSKTDSKQQRIVGRYTGISPIVAKEIVYRSLTIKGKASEEYVSSNEPGASVSSGANSSTGAQPSPEALWSAFHAVIEQIREHRYTPNTVTDEKTGKSSFSVIELTHIPGERRRFDSVSLCLEYYYGDKAERDTVKQRAGDLLRFLQNERNKNVKKLDKLHETLEEAKHADRFRILGELLTASLHMVSKGDREIEVVDYYDENQGTVAIALDPLLSPSENAQRYYKKYTKMKNSLIAVEGQLRSTGEEIAYLETLLQQLDNAGLGDIDEIREELVEQGYLRSRGKQSKKKKKKDSKPVITCYLSSEGIPIYVGKNNTQNEYLTNRLAHTTDTWLHTKDIPGSHVVIRAQTFGDATLREASQLAASFSQAKASSQVPVDYTLIRHVHKPNGSKPGFVIYERQKTLYVTPDEELVRSLKMEQKKG